MILEIDIGNSRIKWRLLDEPLFQVVSAGIATGLEELTRDTLNVRSVSRIRVACVRQQALATTIADWAGSQWQVTAELARVQKTCGGVTIFYKDLNRLGVDRWLAMLAAHGQGAGSSLVVDCGTALTVDLLDGSGAHLGGYIVPGLRLSAKCLEANTEIRLQQNNVSYAEAPGHATDDAVRNGSLVMLLGLINSAYVKLRDAQGVEPGVFLSGGDGALFAEHLAFETGIILNPALVMDGLSVALP